MARLEDIAEPTRTGAANIPCPAFDTTPFVAGPALSERRVAIVSSAALIRRGDKTFPWFCRKSSPDTAVVYDRR